MKNQISPLVVMETELANKILSYLSSKPYIEVAGFINELSKTKTFCL